MNGSRRYADDALAPDGAVVGIGPDVTVKGLKAAVPRVDVTP